MASTRTPPRVSFASLTANNLGTLPSTSSRYQLTPTTGTVRKLNSVLFPIKYSEKFYHDILQPEVEEFCKLSGSHAGRVVSVVFTYRVQASLLQ